MKNIHILPTDKPSRLFDFMTKLILTDKISIDEGNMNRHIYITSDNRIEVNDYITDGYKVWQWKDDSSLLGRKKVILTTDQDLIKDGVQAIDDDFIQWFVKNTNCNKIDIKFETLWLNKRFGGTWQPFPDEYIKEHEKKRFYKIIIPKEEPKQEYQSECICGSECRGFVNVKCKKPKQETLEEAAKEYYKLGQLGFEKAADTEMAFLRGAKWQAEKMISKEAYEDSLNMQKASNAGYESKIKELEKTMYSEEEVLEIVRKSRYNKFGIDDLGKWFEQFKKK